MNHPRAVVIYEEIQKKATEFEHILIIMQVNKEDMIIVQFKTYLDIDKKESLKLYDMTLRMYQKTVHFARELTKVILPLTKHLSTSASAKYLIT